MASLKKCISNHCKECVYDSAMPGTWREQVEQCAVENCALWAVRPLTMSTVNANRTPRGTNKTVDHLEEVC